MAHREPLRYESAIIGELDRAHASLDRLEALAEARQAHSQIVTIHAARELSSHIDDRRATLRSSYGYASFKTARDIESARRQLNAWIERLEVTLHGSNSTAN